MKYRAGRTLGIDILHWLSNPEGSLENHQVLLRALKELFKSHYFFRISGGGYGIGTAFRELHAHVNPPGLQPLPAYTITDFGLNDVVIQLNASEIHQGVVMERVDYNGSVPDEAEKCFRFVRQCYLLHYPRQTL